MSTAPPPTSQPAWYDKYRVDYGPSVSQAGCKITVFDFGSVKQVPPEDWAAAQAAERRELAARPEALRKAEAAKYRRVIMPHFTLRDGHRIPAVGLGTWKADKGQVRAAVHLALQAGYRHIDCASVYQNEDEVGEALHHALSRGFITRSELYICSKVWNNDHAPPRVRAACLRSLKALKLDYLDLYLIHWPVTGNVGDNVQPSIRDTWRALEGLVREGLVRSIGVSNFSTKKLAEILSYAEIPPSVCQVEVHPYHRNDALIAWCKERGIHVTAFSPLGSPDSESIFPRRVPAVLMKDRVVLAVSKRVGRNVGQVLIRWALQHGTSVIPKSTNPDRIRGNLNVLDWELSEPDYRALTSLRFQQRMVNGALWLNPGGPYRTMEELWDEPEIDMDFEESEVPEESAIGEKATQPQPSPKEESSGGSYELISPATMGAAAVLPVEETIRIKGAPGTASTSEGSEGPTVEAEGSGRLPGGPRGWGRLTSWLGGKPGSPRKQ